MLLSIFLTICSDSAFLEVSEPSDQILWRLGAFWPATQLSLLALSSTIRNFLFLSPVPHFYLPASNVFLFLGFSLFLRKGASKYIVFEIFTCLKMSLLPSILIDSLAGYVILENNFLPELWRHCFIVFWLPL